MNWRQASKKFGFQSRRSQGAPISRVRFEKGNEFAVQHDLMADPTCKVSTFG
jgi:hypothetical protein